MVLLAVPGHRAATVTNLLLASVATGTILVHAAFPAVLANYPERRDGGVAGYVATNDCEQIGQRFVLVRPGLPDALVAVADCAQDWHVNWRKRQGYIADVDAALWVGPWRPQSGELWTVDQREWWIERQWIN